MTDECSEIEEIELALNPFEDINSVVLDWLSRIVLVDELPKAEQVLTALEMLLEQWTDAAYTQELDQWVAGHREQDFVVAYSSDGSLSEWKSGWEVEGVLSAEFITALCEEVLLQPMTERVRQMEAFEEIVRRWQSYALDEETLSGHLLRTHSVSSDVARLELEDLWVHHSACHKGSASISTF